MTDDLYLWALLGLYALGVLHDLFLVRALVPLLHVALRVASAPQVWASLNRPERELVRGAVAALPGMTLPVAQVVLALLWPPRAVWVAAVRIGARVAGRGAE
jgi:hypothetical protein